MLLSAPPHTDDTHAVMMFTPLQVRAEHRGDSMPEYLLAFLILADSGIICWDGCHDRESHIH